jgi:hypothetical protein
MNTTIHDAINLSQKLVSGAIDVIRPDNVVGFTAGLSDSSVIIECSNNLFNYLFMEFHSH